MDEGDEGIVVIDAGSGVFKAGFAGQDFPREVFPTVVGMPRCWNEADTNTRKRQLKKLRLDREEMRLRKEAVAIGEENGISSEEAIRIFESEYKRDRSIDADLEPLQYIIGEDALKKMFNMTLSYPMERGNVMKWDEMECLYEYLFIDMLEVDTTETSILLTESPFTSRKSREETAELFFETFGVPSLCLMTQSVLTLYSSGRTTGLVMDSGDSVTHTVPIYEGYMIPHAVNRLNLGGRDVTNYLQRILTEQGLYFNSSAEHHMVGKLKESLCFVSQDFDSDSKRSNDEEFQTTHTLPDGQVLELTKERFRGPEMLFKPMLAGIECPGVADLVMNSFKSCDYTVRNAMYNNVILAGGNTKFRGFQERLQMELNGHEMTFRKFSVQADEDRQFSAWQGGSIFASLSTFFDVSIMFDEYEDYGSSIIHRRVDI